MKNCNGVSITLRHDWFTSSLLVRPGNQEHVCQVTSQHTTATTCGRQRNYNPFSITQIIFYRYRMTARLLSTQMAHIKCSKIVGFNIYDDVTSVLRDGAMAAV